MRGLVLIAHGSRRAAANVEVSELAQRMARQAGARYGVVTHGFLEMAEPSIPDAIQQAIDMGATEVVVVPYFLSAGRHVTEDIPQQVSCKQAEYPAVPMNIAPYLGSLATIPDLLLELTEYAVSRRPDQKISG